MTYVRVLTVIWLQDYSLEYGFHLNPLCVELFWKYVSMYLRFIWFLYTGMVTSRHSAEYTLLHIQIFMSWNNMSRDRV